MLKPLYLAQIALLLFSTVASATSKQKTASPNPSSVKTLTPVTWDAWYNITINNTQKYGTLHETISIDKGRYKYASHLIKLEEGSALEENIGAYASLDTSLEPTFFSFRSLYRKQERIISATIKDKKVQASVTQAGVESAPLTKPFRKGSILEVFFPLWLIQKLPTMKVNQLYGFAAVLQDDLENGFAPLQGAARLELPDAFSQKSNSSKVSVRINKLNYVWYVRPNSAPLRIEIPATKLVMEQVPQDQVINLKTE